MRWSVIVTLSVPLLVIGTLAFTPPVFGQQSDGPSAEWDAELRGNEDHPLRWPVAIAAKSDTELLVADAADSRAIVFRDIGGVDGWQAIKTITLPSAPIGAAFNGERYVLALRGSGGLVALEGDQFRQRKLRIPEGVIPGSVTASQGAIWLHDLAGNRVFLLSEDGDILNEVSVEGSVSALAASPGGGITVALDLSNRILRYAANGTLLSTWVLGANGVVPAWPSGLLALEGGHWLVADRHNGRLVELDSGGRMAGSASRQGWEPGLLRFPAGLDQLPDGRVAVADQGNGRVQLFKRITEK